MYSWGPLPSQTVTWLHDSTWCTQVHLTSNMQLTASTFSNSHLTAWFSLVWSGPPNIKYAVNSQYLLKQSLDCMIQPGVAKSTFWTSNIKFTAKPVPSQTVTWLHDSAWRGQVYLTSNMQLTASTFSNSHLTAWFSLVWSGQPNIKYAVDSQYLLKQSLDCMIQPGVVRST